MKFVPCDGKCTDKGTHCEGCGRSHEEIAAMRKPVEALVALAEKMKYDNLEDSPTRLPAASSTRWVWVTNTP